MKNFPLFIKMRGFVLFVDPSHVPIKKKKRKTKKFELLVTLSSFP